MALKTLLETLDGVDDSIKSLYAEKDGKFYLQIEGIDAHPDVVNLKSAYERVKADKATAIQERDALKAKAEGLPADFDAEVWKRAKEGKPDDAALIRLRGELEGKLTAAEAKANEAEGKLKRFAVERDLSDALTKAGITDLGLSKGARAMLAGMVKASDDGKAIVETDMGPIGIGDYVARWAASEGKAYVTAANGGGRGGNDGKGQSGQKTITRSEFDALNTVQRSAALKGGTEVVDG